MRPRRSAHRPVQRRARVRRRHVRPWQRQCRTRRRARGWSVAAAYVSDSRPCAVRPNIQCSRSISGSAARITAARDRPAGPDCGMSHVGTPAPVFRPARAMIGTAFRRPTMPIRTSLHAATALCCLVPLAASGGPLEVGPGQPHATLRAAIAAASTGDTILIDAAGDYDGDVCAWSKDGLTLRGVNGRPRIDADGNSAQGKAIWVVAGDDTTIENVELSGCRVPDANGAGIRQEGANLTVRHAYFHDNENGILSGARAGSTITIEYSEFAHNGAGDGYSHNLYSS